MNPGRCLVVFDFDHTLVDDNSDPWVLQLLRKAELEVSKMRRSGTCWTDCMQRGFRLLHQSGITRETIRERLELIPLTDSMKQTLHLLSSRPRNDVIIISDSNSVFIDIILSHHGLSRMFKAILTNPAHFDADGLLCVSYHCRIPHHCHRRCPPNMCKGLILQRFLQESKSEGTCYEKVVYIGDGRGDFCACLGLGRGDVAMARKGYSLLDMLTSASGDDELKAELVEWSSGDDLLKFFETS